MLLLSAAACTDSYESTPVDMFTEDYLFSRTDSNGTVVRKYLNRIYYYMRNGHNGVNGDYLDAASDDAADQHEPDPQMQLHRQGQPEIGAEHDDRSVSEVAEAEHAEDQGIPHCHQRVDAAYG